MGKPLTKQGSIMSKSVDDAFQNLVEKALEQLKVMEDDQRLILSWCASLEESKLAGEFEHKPEDSYFLKQVKTICQLATMGIKG